MVEENSAGQTPSRQSLFEGWFDRLITIFNGMGSIWICCFLLLICADIASRGLFNRPLPGVAEVVALSVVACFFLQMPNTLSVGRLNRVQLLTQIISRKSPRTGILIHLATGLLGLITFGALAQASYPTMAHAWSTGEFIGVQGTSAVPTWPARLIVVVGSFLVLVKFAFIAWHDLRQLFARDKPALPQG